MASRSGARGGRGSEPLRRMRSRVFVPLIPINLVALGQAIMKQFDYQGDQPCPDPASSRALLPYCWPRQRRHLQQDHRRSLLRDGSAAVPIVNASARTQKTRKTASTWPRMHRARAK